MLYSAVLALAAVASVAAAPVTEVASGDSYSVTQVRKPNYVRNGKAALQRALGKYGVDFETRQKITKRQDGSVTATPDNGDLEYTCPVQIGTPAQTLYLDFDTGSADLWTFSSLLTSSQQGDHNLYTPSKSSTSKVKSGSTWSISYGDGSSASGSVYTDKVSIGGTVVTAQAVEVAKKVSSSFVSDSNDGLVGLAFSSINTVSPTPVKTFFDNAKANLKSPLFAANLKHNAPGTYDFGAIDTSAYTGSLTYAAVDSSQGFWTIPYTGYEVGSTATTKSGTGIADTGTTLLLVDDAIVAAYYKKVTGAKNSNTYGGYVFPCSATLPSFSLKIGGKYSTVPGSIINYAPVEDGSSTCYGGIQSDSGIGFSIFGDIWLKNFYVVFDAGNSRLGWAPQA